MVRGAIHCSSVLFGFFLNAHSKTFSLRLEILLAEALVESLFSGTGNPHNTQ